MAAVLALDDADLCVRCGRLRSLLCAVYQALDLMLIGIRERLARLMAVQDLSVEEAGFVDAGKVLAVDADRDSGWHGNSTGRGDRCCLTGGVARSTVNHSQY